MQPLVLVRYALLGLAAVFFVLRFFHLHADFPNNSPWMDWAKYTDEGWYGDAAIRHYLFGHWYLAGDFNPAVALPVWPLVLAAVFHFTGVSVVAARATTLCIFGLMLLGLYVLVARFTPSQQRPRGETLAGPLALLLFTTSAFFYAFSRMAILEPLLAALTVAALLTAASLVPSSSAGPGTGARVQRFVPPVLLGLLLPAMVLTKTTGVALFPAVAYMLWHRAGYRLRPALRMAFLPAVIGLIVWFGYLLLLVRPHYSEDYQYLFSANAYTGFRLQPLATVIFNTFADGHWIGTVLYALFFIGLTLFLFMRPMFFRNPLVACLLLWVAGYFLFLAYHNNLQPRYYYVPAVPLTVLVALMIEELRVSAATQSRLLRAVLVNVVLAALVAAIVIPDTLLQLDFVRHPEYTLEAAAQAIARTVRADKDHSQRILSISGSDITLMTGLPSIDDDFGVLDLDQRVRLYRPGWYVAWNQIEDDKMDALTPLYHPVRVATYPAMDDPDRNQLILYRLDPAQTPGLVRRRKLRTPRPLRTRLGQQPTTRQLEH